MSTGPVEQAYTTPDGCRLRTVRWEVPRPRGRVQVGAGFLDMFLPALLVANIDAEITRFVIGVISLTQLIYMSEIGILMIKCEIPLRFKHLLIIFVLRTLIGLPIVLAFAHWVVY